MSEWTLKKNGLRLNAPLLTVVMDGVGLGPDDAGNAVRRAYTPVLDRLLAQHPNLSLAAHGRAVGLPSDADMGNSEVGHNALGAGRIFEQGAQLVNVAIDSGALFEGEAWRWLVEGVKASGEPLHFIGLLSDGNVHSHERHLHAMLRAAAQEGVAAARVHALLDGRDVGERSALTYFDRLEVVLAEINASGFDYQIASGGGRMVVTMDRYEADWSMVARGWDLHARGEGRRFPSARVAIETLREETGAVDQFLPGFVIGDAHGPVGPIRDGASVCFFNFRGDRAIEISRAFEDESLDTFERGPRLKVRYAGMMQYDGDLKLPARFLVTPPAISRTAGALLARQGLRQFACSETQKFGHVTYFWNGNRSGYFDPAREVYQEILSDVVPFEQRPWMKCAEITDATLKALGEGYDHLRINYPNGDMVGHTGDMRAARVAMETLDLSLGRLLARVEALGGVALITADHGNADEMFSRGKGGAFVEDGHGGFVPLTSHTLNPVPFILFDPKRRVPGRLQAPFIPEGGYLGLANVAATTLNLLGFEAPEDYAPSLLSLD
ncbi:2,3-bisphosphoglycerate-independent phosphoglycerate mutase [Myxococcota bacterium]|nr:2,3-bisphosphoglycerate-independent phosphoglycerate mutase [Myxococcota bacterium]MBU1900311.1 2,3-bisphosphoglycerate-independent phosphoglycerate mutase [Myxococcota bacterium]